MQPFAVHTGMILTVLNGCGVHFITGRPHWITPFQLSLCTVYKLTKITGNFDSASTPANGLCLPAVGHQAQRLARRLPAALTEQWDKTSVYISRILILLHPLAHGGSPAAVACPTAGHQLQLLAPRRVTSCSCLPHGGSPAVVACPTAGHHPPPVRSL